MNLTKPLNKYFDHTILKADALTSQIEELCREALELSLIHISLLEHRLRFERLSTHVLFCTLRSSQVCRMELKLSELPSSQRSSELF